MLKSIPYHEKGKGNESTCNPHVRLFNKIARIYSLFFRYQVSHFRRIIPSELVEAGTGDGATVLDIGCGSGALAFYMMSLGFRVTAIDAAPSMIRYARRHARPGVLEFVVADGSAGLPFRDRSFDFVVSSYVLHGMDSYQRMEVMKEAKRLATKKVLFYDYYKRNCITDFVERLEGGDYLHFVENGMSEMKEVFGDIVRVKTGSNMAWHICVP